MRALSLWEPWATLMAIGAKKIETRGRLTHHRGPLLIHASKTQEHAYLAESPEFAAALQGHKLTFGAIVGVVEVYDCLRASEIMASPSLRGRLFQDRGGWREFDLGNYDESIKPRFGWFTQNAVRIEPIPIKGGRGFFEVPDSLILPYLSSYPSHPSDEPDLPAGGVR